MPDCVLVDNDVVLKACCFNLADEAVTATTVRGIPPAMLGVGKYVVRGRLCRARNIVDRERANAEFERFSQAASFLEPDEAELILAADLEAEASRLNLELDGGESQLLAILVVRGCRLLLTGDKRAITAISVIATEMAKARIACFEQLISHITRMLGSAAVRLKVCSEPDADRASSLCFSCSRELGPGDAEVLAALASYIGDVDRNAPGILISGTDLGALAADADI